MAALCFSESEVRAAIFIASCVLFGGTLIAFDQRDEAVGSRLAQKLYIRERVAQLQHDGLASIHQRLAERPVYLRQPRWWDYPCQLKNKEGVLEPWGTDLPPPDREWVTFHHAHKDATSKIENITFIRFVELSNGCWAARMWNHDWPTVKPHQSVSVSTNAFALVSVPKTSEEK